MLRKPKHVIFSNALLITFVGLACSLSVELGQPTLVPPARDPGSGLVPAQPTKPSELTTMPTAQSMPVGGGLRPAPEPTPTALPPTALPEIETAPPGSAPDEFGRPRLSGTAKALDTAHFRVHYTLTGADAVPETDGDENGHPDYVDDVARAIEYSWQMEIEHFGWAPPPPDEGEGGDDRYDVYLENIFEDGTAGYTDGGYAQTLVGDNPHTAAIETRSSHSFLALDNDYAELLKWDDDITPLAFMHSTAAHEFLHAIQYGYDAEEPADWLWESTATWMQDEVFDEVNDGNDELSAVFKSPDTCQVSEGFEGVESDGHWYGMWILLRYISERHGHAAVRGIWEHARDLDGYAAIEAAMADAGTTLDSVQRGFHLALLTRDFEEGVDYPTLRLEGDVQPGQTFMPADGVQQMAADYVEIQANGVVTVRLRADGLEGALAGVRAGQMSVFPLTGGQGTVDAAQFDHLYLVVANLNRADDEFDCAFTSYTVVAERGQQPQAPAQTLPAPNFIAPQFEALLDE